ncbi:50S ribosomal protein L18 [Candidatus Dojkabacteria bacterium]|nr:50S ribosomal protein L18 [Candidatus Dojkabacteria bacterium]
MREKEEYRKRRKMKIRKKISGTADRPRLAVFRSNAHIYAQLIDDENNVTLGSASDLDLKAKGTKTERAETVGKEIAKIAKSKKIETIIFDRGGYKFHGRVKALADGAKEAGLIF